MMQPWYSQKETSSQPDAIILPTQFILDRFVRRVKMLAYEAVREELIEKQNFIIESIIQALQYDNKLQLEIAHGTMDLVRHEFHLEDREEIGLVAAAVEELALDLYGQLKDLKAYQGGYLFYQYHSFDGRDVVLVRLAPPELHVRKPYDRNRRW